MIYGDDTSRIFRFKQFEMLNDLVGLKVGTDGVLLGAWARLKPYTHEVWDIGTGTGLIALMLAQRAPQAVSIVGFELDEGASNVASANFNNSPWSNRLKLVSGDVLTTHAERPDADLIVANPPYFKDSASLSAKGSARDLARRGVALDYSAVIYLAAERLSPKGTLCIVLPANILTDVECEAAFSKLYLSRITMVSSKMGKSPTRMLCELSRCDSAPLISSTLYIRDNAGHYTADYRNLTADFYLHF